MVCPGPISLKRQSSCPSRSWHFGALTTGIALVSSGSRLRMGSSRIACRTLGFFVVASADSFDDADQRFRSENRPEPSEGMWSTMRHMPAASDLQHQICSVRPNRWASDQACRVSRSSMQGHQIKHVGLSDQACRVIRSMQHQTCSVRPAASDPWHQICSVMWCQTCSVRPVASDAQHQICSIRPMGLHDKLHVVNPWMPTPELVLHNFDLGLGKWACVQRT